MYNKNNLLVAKCASKQSLKPELRAVAFCGNRTMATDSFRFLEISADGEAHEPKIIQADEVVRLLKLGKEERVELDRIEQVVGHEARKCDYPDIDSVMKQAEAETEYTEVHINGAYIAEVVAALSNLNKFAGVTMRVPHGKHKPLLFYSYARKNEKEKQTGRGLVMPFNN